jgi:GT2 family glycosyltransferase
MSAVGKHVAPLGAGCVAGPFDTVKVQWPLPEELPSVSIIVPTRDRLEFLRPCLRSVLERTDYENFEIIVIDNGSAEARTKAYLEEVSRNPRIRVFSFPGPYNFPAINNFAVQQARASYLCLLNNDTEVIEKTWLSQMMRYAVRPDVGAVGAKLLYDDGSIQHAGVVIGIGGAAGHVHRFLPAGEPGYFRQPHVSQFVSAVTAACLVVDKHKFLAVGGLDEVQLPVAFNDVDFCLKLQAAGWHNVYVPHAVLLHHESKTRESDISRQNIDRFRREVNVLQDRWNTETYDDPFHNPNLDRATETFIVRV